MSDGWSRESIEAAMERAAERYGPGFTVEEYNSMTGVPSKNAVAREFGTFDIAKRELGLKPNTWNWTAVECLDAIRTVADECGDPPTSGEYAEAVAGRDLPSHTVIIDRWGSWADARKLALE